MNWWFQDLKILKLIKKIITLIQDVPFFQSQIHITGYYAIYLIASTGIIFYWLNHFLICHAGRMSVPTHWVSRVHTTLSFTDAQCDKSVGSKGRWTWNNLKLQSLLSLWNAWFIVSEDLHIYTVLKNTISYSNCVVADFWNIN